MIIFQVIFLMLNINTVKPVYNGHPWDLKKAGVRKRCLMKLKFRLVVNKTNWPLLTGGRYSQVLSQVYLCSKTSLQRLTSGLQKSGPCIEVVAL
jgi:hypothetical protein